MSELVKAKWDNLNAFRMDQGAIDDVINEAHGCSVCWVRKDGHPLAVWVSHAMLDGKIYVTSTENRPKTMAWLKDPRTSAVFEVNGKGAVTIVGRVKMTKDAALRRRFLNELFGRLSSDPSLRDKWLEHMDTPNRFVGELAVEKYITFDSRKLEW